MRAFAFGVVVVAACSLAVAGFTLVQDVDGFEYKANDVGSVSMAGVCSATPDEITCWKPTGERAADLSETISAHFLANSNDRLELQYRSRSLLLVTKATLASGGGAVNWTGLVAEPGPANLRQGSVTRGRRGAEQTEYCWYYPLADQATATVSARLEVAGKPVRLGLKEKAEADIAGARMRVTRVTPMTEQEQNRYKGRRTPGWYAYFDLDGVSPEAGNMRVSAYDFQGKQIINVDDKGRPISAGAVQALSRVGRAYYATVSIDGPGRLHLSVNPADIAYLMVTPMGHRKVTFKNVALQPSR